MKKNLFIILVSMLFILVLIYLYDVQESVLNKEYYDSENNISVNYPYFNNVVIDNYVNDYLESYIEQSHDFIDLLFIDYDYEELDDRIELMLYIYQEMGNIVKRESTKIDVDINNGLILSSGKVIDTGIEYDVYNNSIIDKNKPMVALTFDDGPNYNTSRVLDILDKYNVRATFFVLGSNIKGNENIIKRMNDLEMEIGNHMYSHKLLTKLDSEQILLELKRVDEDVFNIIGKYPTLIRPSYGSINSKIRKIMDRPIITWNIDTLDWKYHNSNKIAKRVLRSVDDGDIILMHDIYRATANSLELIIPDLLNDGYQFVTVSELLYYNGINPLAGELYTRGN